MGYSIEDVKIQGTGMEDRWGISVFDYRMEKVAGEGMTQVDFRDLTTFIAERRAVEIEQELQPLSARITARNKRLEKVGKATSEMAAFTAKLPGDATKDQYATSTLSYGAAKIIYEVSGGQVDLRGNFSTSDQDDKTVSITLWKDTIDKSTQFLKTETDKLNNESQLDMNRMQGVVQHRDNSYNTATSMMTSISDSVSNAIKSMS